MNQGESYLQFPKCNRDVTLGQLRETILAPKAYVHNDGVGEAVLYGSRKLAI